MKEEMESFWPKSRVISGSKIWHGIVSNWRLFESNWIDIHIESNSVLPMTQLFRSKWLDFFFQSTAYSTFQSIVCTIGQTFGLQFGPLTKRLKMKDKEVSWLFNLNECVYNFTLFVSGPLCEEFGFRTVCCVASFFVFVSYALMSVANSVFHVFMLYGIMIGEQKLSDSIAKITCKAREMTSRKCSLHGFLSLYCRKNKIYFDEVFVFWLYRSIQSGSK